MHNESELVGMVLTWLNDWVGSMHYQPVFLRMYLSRSTHDGTRKML